MVSDGPTRRSILASLGVGAGAALLPAGRGHTRWNVGSGQGEHVISINSPSDVSVEYEFAVSGSVEKSDHVPPGLPHDEASRDSDDVIRGSTVQGRTQGGVDSYRYTGSITSFSATNCTQANVWVDDARIDACAYPDPNGAGHVISINSPSDERVTYEFRVASSVEKSSAVPPGVPHDRASMDPADEIDGRTVSGFTQGGVDTYTYDELVAFAITSDNCGAANVWIDEEPVDACVLDGRYPPPRDRPEPELISPPTRIIRPGYYVLDADASATGTSPGIEITADDVTLDGRGNCLDGGGALGAIGVHVRGVGVTLRNLCVEGFETCVRVDGLETDLVNCSLSNVGTVAGTALVVTALADCRALANSVYGSDVGAALRDTEDALFWRNDLGAVGTQGLVVDQVSDATFADNAVGGLTAAAIASRSDGLEFRRNVFAGDEEDGLSVVDSSGVVVEDNVADGHSANGVGLFDATDCVVRDNTTNGNGDAGVSLDGADRNVVTGNTVRDNGGDGGIVLTDADDNEVTGNTLCDNGGPSQIVVEGASTGNVVRNNTIC